MSILITADHLELHTWQTQTGLDINPIPADSYAADTLPGGILRVVNISSQAGGAALVTCKDAFGPDVNTAAYPYYGLDLKAYAEPAMLLKWGREEIDVKRCTTPGIVANTSSERNSQTAFWEIDGNPPGWQPTAFQPNVTPGWMQRKFRYHMDADGFSVLSTKWGKMAYDVPLTMQNVPLQKEPTWGNVFAIQLQNMILEPGTLVVDYLNITAYLSDAPIA